MSAENWIEACNKPQAIRFDPNMGAMWSDYVLVHIYNNDNRYDEFGTRVTVGYYHYVFNEWHDVKENVLKDVSHWMALPVPQGIQ